MQGDSSDWAEAS